MIAEITQAQNCVALKAKAEKHEKVSLDFDAELKKKMEYTEAIEQLLPQNATNTASTKRTREKTTEPKEPTKTRVEETIDMLKQMVQNAALKAKSSLSPEKIANMSLSELKSVAESLMDDMKLFTTLANSIEYLKNVPEDCCCMLDFDSNGKCILFKIFRSDGTTIDGNLGDVPGFYTDDDLKQLIEKMDLASLKNFCLDGADPLKLFEDIFDNFKNTDFGDDKELSEKIKKIPEQIEQIKESLKEADSATSTKP